MAGPLNYVKAGEPAFPQINAGMLNAIIEFVKRGERGRTITKRPVWESTVIVNALNESATDADIFDVLTISNIGLDIDDDLSQYAFQYKPLFNIDTPAASDDFPCVALEPIPRYKIGKVAIGGIAVCTVNVTDAAHEYANPTASNRTKMTSAATGQCRILWKDTGTGDKTAVVYLYQSSGGSCDTWLSVEPLLTATCSGGDIVTTTLTGYEFCVREA